MNFILEKRFTYCTNVHSYFEKGNKYISTYKSQCFKGVYDFMPATLITVLGRMCPVGHGLDSPGLNHSIANLNETNYCFQSFAKGNFNRS